MYVAERHSNMCEAVLPAQAYAARFAVLKLSAGGHQSFSEVSLRSKRLGQAPALNLHRVL